MRKGVKIAPNAAKRIIEAARYIEQQPRNSVAPQGPPVDFAGITIVHLTVACNPMSGVTPGANGRGKIQQFNGTSYSDLSTTVYPILNDIAKTIAIGAYVQCLPGPGGLLHVINVDNCSNLS